MRRYPTLRLRVIEREYRIRRAARLERANLLEVLSLEVERCADLGIERAAREHRRPMNERRDSGCGRAYRCEIG